MIGDEFRLALRNHWADTDDVSALLETLAAELERPRELSARVVSYLGGTYGIDYDNVGAFLEDELPKLEDDEIDLILSPVFTPKLADQLVFAELLGSDSVPRAQWPALIQQLVTRPIRARLVTADSRSHSVALREVTVERYVYRLRLDAAIPASLFQLLERTSSAADRSLLKAVARQAIWENDGRRNILARFLTTAGGSNNYRLASDAVELLRVGRQVRSADDATRTSGTARARTARTASAARATQPRRVLRRPLGRAQHDLQESRLLLQDAARHQLFRQRRLPL